MARISTYGNDPDLELSDKVIGTDGLGNGTVNYTLSQLNLFFAQNVGAELVVAADDTAAAAAGIPVGRLYRTATGEVRVRVA